MIWRMTWTFILTLILIVIVLARTTPASDNNCGTAVARHRFGMSCLVGRIQLWGALQGLEPAIALSIMGDNPSTSAYLGNQPGLFSPAFFLSF